MSFVRSRQVAWWGAVLVLGASVAVTGCKKKPAQEEIVEKESEEEVDELEADGNAWEYSEKRIKADDPRTRMRGALEALGQGDGIAEDATEEEMAELIDEKVEAGAIPKEIAEKLKGTMAAATEHNERLQQMDDDLFGSESAQQGGL